MSSIRALLPAGVALAASLTACSGGGSGGSLPAGSDLLKQSSTAMGGLTSVGFQLSTDGQPGIPVQSANGRLLKSGEAEGTLTLKQQGTSAALNFTVTGDSIYFKGPTGGYRKLPRSMVTTFLNYDPSAILDPAKGVALLLTKATGAKSEAQEKVGGVEAYRISATLPKDAASALVPGVSKDLKGQIWVGTTDHRVVKVKADMSGGSVTIAFSDFNGNFTIAKPS